MANHISHASIPYPIKNARYTVLVPFLDADGDPTDPTTPDTEVSQDAGAFADAAEEVTTITGSNGLGYITFSGAETNNSAVGVCFKVASGPKATLMTFYPMNLATVGAGTLSAGSAGGGTLGTVLAYDVTGCFIRTTGGTGGGGTGGANNQARRIVTYTTSTGAFTVTPNWETTPSTDTTYDVLLPDGVTLGMLRTLNPTTAGRTLDVSTGGEAGVDWANVGSPTTTLALTGTTIAVTQKVDVETIKTNPVVNGGTITFPTTATLASTTNITAGTITTATNVTTVNGLAAGVITATSIASDAITDAKVASDVTIASVTGAVGSVTATVSADVVSVSGDSTAADNLEKEYDGTGYGHILQRATIATLASQTSFTLTAGSADNDAYNGCIIVIEDASTAAQKAVAVVDDYTGATKTITLRTDPAVFAMATTDIVTVIADKALKPTVDFRTLDVSATGEAGVDWANVGTPGSTVNLSATTTNLVNTVTTYTGNTVQTGDSFARLGAPAGASVSADILVIDNLVDDLESRIGTPSNLGGGATLSANLSDIEAQTDDIGVAGAGLTDLGGMSTTMKAQVESEVDDALGSGTGTALTAIPWNAAWDAEVQSEVDDALVVQRLDELLNADSDIDGAAPPTVGSVFHELLTKTAGSFTYDQTTDSLEAIRDRGDAAWITAAGFSTHSAADVWAVATRILTAGTNIQLPSNGLANVTAWTVNVTGTLSGNVGGIASGGITSASFATASITADAIATDAIGSAELAASAITEIQSGLSTLTASDIRAAVGLASANLDTQIAAVQSDTDNIQTRIPAALTSDGNIKADTLRVSGTTQTAGDLAALINTVDDLLDTEVAAIKAKTDSLTFTTAGRVDATVLGYASGQSPNIRKNTALSNFEFPMYSSTAPDTLLAGLTVTATRSIDGGAFASCTNSPSEVGSGVYKIDLSAADLNGDCITLKMTAALAGTTLVTIVTQPT